MSSLKFSEVVSCLEKTDPKHPPSFYYALEVVKRYARAKIAKGSSRHLICRHGKLETLEAKFAPTGLQDIFYLARLQLKLLPSSLNLPSPSLPVLQTLIKAGYPLPTNLNHVESDRSHQQNNGNNLPRKKPFNQGRRGSRSLTSSPNPSSADLLLQPITTSIIPTSTTIASSSMRRSSSAKPDLPSTINTTFMNKPKTKSSPRSSVKPSSSRSFSESHFTTNSPQSKWTPLLSGLGFKSVFDHHQDHHHQQQVEKTSSSISSTPISTSTPQISFNSDPFKQLSPLSMSVSPVSDRDQEEIKSQPLSPSSDEIISLNPLNLNDEEELVPLELILNESRLTKYEEAFSFDNQRGNYNDTFNVNTQSPIIGEITYVDNGVTISLVQ
ncbi:uncharacterized protein L201_001305 [Kwoniella dendrophila CBS 6074]|uniref:Uncharacterized protein n=1 Tax=Kwoniella dendrophila CBS 6074 TaxID=1295534 RepID=A0AAX4JPN5_9TREE